MPKHKITIEQSEQRIDQMLTELMDLSRSQIQKLIKSGDITLNDETCKPHTNIMVGDEVFFPELEIGAPSQKTGPTPILEILYQDDDLLVINKQAGLIVHQASSDDTEPNVVDALLELYPEIINVGENPIRPGIVHRLDKDVSGVMVIAKTQEAFEHLKNQFKTRTTKKTYLALVYGQMSKDFDTIDLKIGRSKTKGRMVARPNSQEGKDAITEYDVIERFKNTTYIRVKILTGRTHQIRVHLRALDHPLVGDKLYKKKQMKNIRRLPLERIFLHATTLTIKLMNGKEKTFDIPLPIELEGVLKKLSK